MTFLLKIKQIKQEKIGSVRKNNDCQKASRYFYTKRNLKTSKKEIENV